MTSFFEGENAPSTVLDEARALAAALAPMSGVGAPSITLGLVGSFYRDLTDPFNPIDYGPKTEDGWGVGRPVRGPAGFSDSAFETLSDMIAINPMAYPNPRLVSPAGIDGGVANGSFEYREGDFSAEKYVRDFAAGNKVALTLIPITVGALVRSSGRSFVTQRNTLSLIADVDAKLRRFVMADLDYGFRSDRTASYNTGALQEAVNQAEVVMLPNGPDPILFNTIELPPNTKLAGRGDQTLLLALGDYAFTCQAPDGTGSDFQGPWLEDLNLFCANNGIRFNSPTRGFSDATGQKAMFRPRLDRVRIRRSRSMNDETVGLEFNKCFDGMVTQCEIDGFDIGYVGRGSDLIEISGRSRIWRCNTLIDIIRVVNAPYRYGSHTRIVGCDLLAARDRYIRSQDFDLLVEGNYFEHSLENGVLTDYAIEVIVHDRARFVGNTVQLQATDFSDPPAPLVPKFLKVTSDPGNLFTWEDNGNDGLAFGIVQWNENGGQPYWINTNQRSRIIQRGTSGLRGLPLPFNTSDDPESLPWRFSPSLPGLRNSDYGGSVRCSDNAFAIPYAAGEQNISFQPVDAPIAGTVDVWVQARADTAGKILTLYNTNGGAFVTQAEQALTTTYGWYKLFAAIVVTNLVPFALNKDATKAGNVYIREIKVIPS